MGSSTEEKREISFIHISDDVIITDDMTGYDAAMKWIPRILFGLFSIGGLILLWSLGLTWENVLISIIVTYTIPFFITLFLGHSVWFEIDRKEGVIKRWSNKKKKKLLPPIRKGHFSVIAAETRRGGRYDGIYRELFAQERNGKKVIEQSLYIFPKEIEMATAEVMAKKIETFLHEFLSGSNKKKVTGKYVFPY